MNIFHNGRGKVSFTDVNKSNEIRFFRILSKISILMVAFLLRAMIILPLLLDRLHLNVDIFISTKIGTDLIIALYARFLTMLSTRR